MMNIEVGDMINLGVGWDNVRKKNGYIVWLETGGFIREHEIKYIRKPRPGSKESRDIVAKLLRRALNFRRQIDENISYRVIYEIVISDYEIAKSMLQVQS